MFANRLNVSDRLVTHKRYQKQMVIVHQHQLFTHGFQGASAMLPTLKSLEGLKGQIWAEIHFVKSCYIFIVLITIIN
jgi:hypothetical protein